MIGLSSKCTAEFIGTFALTFIGAGSIITTQWNNGSPGLIGIALAHGVALSIAVSAAMNISGGHINPAVTVAMLFTRRIGIGDALAYIISQCAGAIVAGYLLATIFVILPNCGDAAFTGEDAMKRTLLGTPNFAAGIPMWAALITEAAMTFLLLFAVFGTAVDERAPKIGGFGIGLMVMVDILMGGPITGAAMNPARTLGTLVGGGSITQGLWNQHWLYWAGPCLGAVLAALIYDGLILKRSNSPA